MVVRKTKKMRNKRGYDRGKGESKRNRGAGNRGGRGRAGIGKRAGHNKWRYIKEGTQNLGKNGFVSVKQRRKFHPISINVDQLDKLSSRTGQKEINLPEMGYQKLLGKGKVVNKLVVNVPKFTESAKRKIESAGGKIVGAEETTEQTAEEQQ